jgi:asparagine synthase (glutamine-hydrolysing)
MCAMLRHRGPDDEGVHVDPQAGVTIGARRLSIMDVAGGHQPLCNEDRSVWVAFNGEIYNHSTLREDLRARGHQFATGADTEVLVHLYEDYGDALVHALEGMFAFALWDERRGRLLLARDRFGEKPLFLHEHGGQLTFASELTALVEVLPGLRELDPAAIDAFFVFAYVPGPNTIVSGARQLPPGHLLSWTRESRTCEERCWWSPPDGAVHPRERREQVLEEVRRLFAESVRTRLVADVPVGVFLSGGVDSTLVAIEAARQSSRRLKTFTVGYDVGSVDETLKARSVAKRLGSEHHELTLDQAEIAQRVPTLLARMDQPLADPALVPLNALSEFARPRVTVALGGEGADELFAGYPRYRWLQRAAQLDSALPGLAGRSLTALLGNFRPSARGARLAARFTPPSLIERHLNWVTGERRDYRRMLYGPRLAEVDSDRVLTELTSRAGDVDGKGIVRSLMRLDQIDYLPDDVLVKTDRAGMLASLEIRTVFLQRELAELAASVDTSLHLAGGGKSLVHGMLPEGIIQHRRVGRYRKTAFRVPAADWLRGPLVPVLQRQLDRGTIYLEGYFDQRAAQTLAREHLGYVHDHSALLWPLLALGLWVDRFRGLDVE